MNKKTYEHPNCYCIRCMEESELLGTTAGKNDPKHGGEDNLAKPNNDWDCEDEDITIQN
mgnify:CR=1 FL=1